MNSLLSLMERFFGLFAPIADLLARVYVSYHFIMSGYAKYNDMAGTIALFKNDYHVPFLTAQQAAFTATGIELIVPVFLILGFFGQFSAFVLFAFNIAAVYSYEFLQTSAGINGFMLHAYWGTILMLLMVHGVGSLSIDRLFRRYN